MKTAATVLTIIGMIVTALTMPYATAWGIILIVLDVIFGVISLITLATNTKSIFVGVMDLLFCGLLGGIFYLCWNPEN